MLIGTNNSISDVAWAQYPDHMEQLVSTIGIATHGDVDLTVVHSPWFPFPFVPEWGGYDQVNARIEAEIQIDQSVCDRYEFAVCGPDLFHLTEGRADLFGDFVHTNQAGADLFAQMIVPEPSTLLMIWIGLVSITRARWSRRLRPRSGRRG